MIYKGKLTPWQRVYRRFGMSQSQLAKELRCHRSKICRALRDVDGLINGRDQQKLLAAAHRLGVSIDPADFLPGVRNDGPEH